MPTVRVRVLGSTVLEVDGRAVRMPPTTGALLARLVLANGDWVSTEELALDLWPGEFVEVRRRHRGNVHRHVHYLRKLLDPEWAGDSSDVLPISRGGVTRYRVAIDRDAVDLHRFWDLIDQAALADRAAAVDLLGRALALWRGQPLLDFRTLPFARSAADRITEVYRAARRDLIGTYLGLGQTKQALAAGMQLLADFPDEAATERTVRELRQRQRDEYGSTVFRQAFRGAGATEVIVVISTGDLFAQSDANLVVGFTDTFDTSIDQNLVISSSSVQGQLLLRLYGGDRGRLDQELKRGLRTTPRVGTDLKRDKPHGKLIRYPVGTVVPLVEQNPRVFAVAYSRMGHDLVARSDVDALVTSLNNLWPVVYRYGQMQPVAVPLLGTGLSRIASETVESLGALVIRTFVEHARRGLVSPELRLIVLPEQLERLDLVTVKGLLKSL